VAYLTKRELLNRFRYYTLQLESQLLRGDDFNALTDAIPFQIHLNAANDLSLLATNHAFTEQLGYQIGEIRELGWEVFKRCVHPQSLDLYPALLERAKRRTSAIFTFAHQLFIRRRKSDYSPVVTFTKPTKLPGGPLLCLSPLPHNFGSMVDKVQQVVEVDQFKLNNLSRFQQLTPREIEILRLLGEGCNNPQISEQLSISRETVATHRKNLKSKLDIHSFRDLMRYALAFGLIKI